MKKRFKVIAVIMATCVILMTSALSVFADGAILTPNIEGLYQASAFVEADVTTIGGKLPVYPDGSETQVDGYLNMSYGKHMSTALTTEELVSLNKNATMTYNEFHEVQVRKYADDYEYYFHNEYVRTGFWNRLSRYKDTVYMYSTVNGSLLNNYGIERPRLVLEYSNVPLSRDYIEKYKAISYINFKFTEDVIYDVVVSGKVSYFNNVTGEMTYLSRGFTKSYGADGTSGNYQFRISPLDLMRELTSDIESDYFEIRDLYITVNPMGYLNESKISEIAFASPASNGEVPRIDDVWNNQNKAFNWTNFTDWISIAVGGFLSFEIMPNITIMGIIGLFMTVALLIWLLKVFAGG